MCAVCTSLPSRPGWVGLVWLARRCSQAHYTPSLTHNPHTHIPLPLCFLLLLLPLAAVLSFFLNDPRQSVDQSVGGHKEAKCACRSHVPRMHVKLEREFSRNEAHFSYLCAVLLLTCGGVSFLALEVHVMLCVRLYLCYLCYL